MSELILEAQAPELREFNQEDRLKQAMRDLGEAERENERLRKEVTALAIESIERGKTLARLEAEVMQLLEAQRWIPVTERLPETTTVLGCNKYGVVEPVLYMSNAKRWVVMPNARVRIDVTHWMPLPAAPEEGAGK